MPLDTSHNSSFSKLVPGLQLAWDSTSLGYLKECPKKYYFKVVLGHMGSSENVHLMFGDWYHKALERYDHLRAEGKDHEFALHSVVEYLLKITVVERKQLICEPQKYGRPKPQIMGIEIEIKQDSAGHGCGGVFQFPKDTEVEHKCPSCGCQRVSIENGKFPWISDDKNKSRFNLIRTVIWYLEQFKDHPLETVILSNGKPAVELSFRFEPGWFTGDGEPYVLCGHLDRLAKVGEEVHILDRKTTKSTISRDFFEGFTPDNQMSLYTVGGRICFGQNVKGVIIDGAQVAVNFSRFERGFAGRTLDMQEEWMTDALMWIENAEKYARRQHWPMNDKSCHNYGGCEFQSICSKSPNSREIFLKKIETRTWDPLVPR